MDTKYNNRTISKRQRIGSIVVPLYCLLILGVMVSVLMLAYDPHMNSVAALASTSMDVVCLIILLNLVISLTFDRVTMGRTTRLFLALMLGTMWAVFFDFLTWSLDGSLVYGGWTFWFTIASLCSGSVLGGIFSLYLGSYLNYMYKLKDVLAKSRVCFIIDMVAFVLTFTLAITKSAFNFVDGHYVTGVLYDVITVLPVLTLIYMAGYSLRHVKTIGIHDAFSVLIFIFFMIGGALVEAAFGFGATYVAVTIADVFIFVMLQNKHIAMAEEQNEQLEINVGKWMEKSNTDEVTGFFNRHAYEEEIEALEKTTISSDFVYVSMDVNGLKVVNDSKGHDVGDELLIGASSCMKKSFEKYGKLFRIGGDEFVALIFVNESELGEIMDEFKKTVKNWRGEFVESLTISYGYVTRREIGNMTLHQMAVLADKRMYEDKARYYQKKGVDRRGQRDAHIALCAMYIKILKINVTDDTYQIVNMDDDERHENMGLAEKLSDWFREFGKAGLVHPDDLEQYLKDTDIQRIRDRFLRDKSPLRVFYRRKHIDGFAQTMMEIIPSENYSDDSQNLFLYVKDIGKEA